MPSDNRTLANIPLKLGLGKAHTSNSLNVNQESITSTFISSTQNIWALEIDENPTISEANGVVSPLLELDIERIGVGFSTYQFKLPSNQVSKLTGVINPETESNYVSGDLISRIIPVTFGSGYDVEIKNSSGTILEKADSSNWNLDPFRGLINQENEEFPLDGGTIKCRIYIGKYLSQALTDIDNIVISGGGTPQSVFDNINSKINSLSGDVQSLGDISLYVNKSELSFISGGLEERITENETNISNILSSISSIEADINSISGVEGVVLPSDLNDIKTNINSISGDLNTLQSNFSVLDSNVTNLQSTHTNDVNTINSDIFELSSRIDEISGNIDFQSSIIALSGELKSDISGLQGQITTNSNDITTLQNDIASLSISGGSVLPSDINNLQTQINNISGSHDSVETRVSTLESTTTGLSNNLIGVNNNLSQLLSNDSVFENNIELINTNITNISASLDNLNASSQSSFSTIQGDISNLTSEVQQNESDISLLRSDLESVSLSGGVILPSQIDEITTNIQNISSNISGIENDIIDLQNQDVIHANLISNLESTKLDLTYFQSISGDLGDTLNVSVSGSTAGRYVNNNIGDGISEIINVIHNLATEDVVVSVRDNITNEIVMASIEVVDELSIRLHFTQAPTNNQYSVIVMGYSNVIDVLTQSNIATISSSLEQKLDISVFQALSGSGLDESHYVHTSGNESISGNKTFINDLTVQGTLTVAGSAVTLNTQHVLAEDNLIVVNHGEIGSGVTSISAGIQVDRGIEDDYFFIFDENKGNFRIGESNSLQAVATRDEIIANDAVVIWDSSQNKFVDSSFTISDISGGSSISDIKDTYTTTSYKTENYDIEETGSVVVPVISISGGFNVNPNNSVDQGIRFKVHDVGNFCGTNPVTISGGNLGKINTDGGSIEFARGLNGWVLIDKFENIWDRDEVENEVTVREGETLVANKARLVGNGDSFEIVDENNNTVALINSSGKIQGKSGEFGQIGQDITKEAQADFTNVGSNVDATVTGDVGNVISNNKAYDQAILSGSITQITGDMTNIKAVDIHNNTGSGASYAVDWTGGSWTIDLGAATSIGGLRVIGLGWSASDYNRFGVDLEGSLTSDTSDFVSMGTHDIEGNTEDGPIDIMFGQNYNVRWIKLSANSVTQANFKIYIGEIQWLIANPTSTNNTFDTNLSLSSGSFDPSTFVAYDENDLPINGAGKLNVAYAVDGGAFVALVDQDTFKALDPIPHTTQFDLQLQLVGDQRLSSLKLSTTSGQTMQILNDGSVIASSGRFGLAGEVSEQSVADMDFTNIETNVDQTVADEFGNDAIPLESVVDRRPWTANTDMWEIATGDWEGLLNGTASPTFASGPLFVVDLGDTRDISSFSVTIGSGGWGSVAFAQFEGSDDWNGTAGNFQNIGSSITLAPNFTGSLTLDTPVTNRYVRLTGSTNGSPPITTVAITYNNGNASTNNTFDTNLATGTAGTFAAGSFKAYDENDTLINGTGKINVAYSVDGGAFIGVHGSFSDMANNTGTPTLTRVDNDADITQSGQDAARGFDGSTLTNAAVSSLADSNARLKADITTPAVYKTFRITQADSYATANQLGQCRIEGYNGATWTTLNVVSTDTGSNSGDTITLPSGNGSVCVIETSNSTEYEDYALRYISAQGGFTGITGIAEFEARSAATDQDTFKALGDIAYTSQFDLRLQLVGAQRFSRATIATPNNILHITSTGDIRFLESDVEYAKISKNGLELPQLTTSEQSSITPSESLLVYNETNSNVEFYNGTSWIKGLRKHEEIIGNDSDVEFTVSHNFNTRSLTYSILDNNTYELVDAQVTLPTENSAVISFSVAPDNNEYTVTIVG
jgi:predicted  nucleic acid-binding Zn-ribbon protein